MAATTEDLVFRGGNGEACEEFIFTIRRWAFARELSEDDELVARYASSCIAGDALRFYETLDEDVQKSWRLLRQALLSRYPAPDPTIPTPATVSSGSRAAGGDTCTGVIRVIIDGESIRKYLSRMDGDSHGTHKVTTNISEALVVKFRRSSDLQPIRILNSSIWLGLSWCTADARRAIGSSSWAWLVCVDHTGYPKCRRGNGPSQWLIWRYNPRTRSLVICWFEDDEEAFGVVWVDIEIGMDVRNNDVCLYKNVAAYGDVNWKRAHLAFESV